MELARDGRRAPADRRPARQAGGAGSRGDRDQRPAWRTSGASTSWRWRPRTGSRACGLPREARAGVQGPLSAGRAGRRRRRRDDGGAGSPRSLRSAATRRGCTTRFPTRSRPGCERLRAALAKGAAQGLWSEADADAASARVGAAPSLGDLAGCDLVVEAAPEDLELKRELFAVAGRGLRPGDDPRHQHLLPAGDGDRRRSAEPRARRRHALLQPAGADEAGRGGRHGRLGRERPGGDGRGRQADGPHADPRQGQPRLHRQPPRPPLHAGVAADARRRGSPTPRRSTASAASAAASGWARSS